MFSMTLRVSVTAKGRYTFEKAVFGLNEFLIDVPDMALLEERRTVSGRKRNQFNFRLEREAFIAGSVHAADNRVRIEGVELA